MAALSPRGHTQPWGTEACFVSGTQSLLGKRGPVRVGLSLIGGGGVSSLPMKKFEKRGRKKWKLSSQHLGATGGDSYITGRGGNMGRGRQGLSWQQ